MNKLNDYEKANLRAYQWLIGKLMYLIYGTRPKIAFAIEKLSKYNADPWKSHFQATKRVVY